MLKNANVFEKQLIWSMILVFGLDSNERMLEGIVG